MSGFSCLSATLLLSLAIPGLMARDAMGRSLHSPASENYNLQAEFFLNKCQEQDRLARTEEENATRVCQQALELHKQSLTQLQGESQWERKAKTLQNIGNIYWLLNKPEQALSFDRRYLAVYQEFGDKQAEATTLTRLGSVYRRRSSRNPEFYAQTLEFYQQAIALYQELGDLENRAKTLKIIGDIYFADLQEYEKALEFYRPYLNAIAEGGGRQVEAKAIVRLGDNYRRKKIYERAIEFYQQFLAIQEELGDTERQVWGWVRLGDTYFLAEQYKQGIESFQAAITLQQKRRDRLGEARVLNSLGMAYLRQGQDAQADKFLRDSIGIYQIIVREETDIEQLRVIEKTIDPEWGILLQTQSRVKLDLYQMAIALYRKLGDKQKEADFTYGLGIFYLDRDRYQKAVELHQQYLILHRELYGIEKEKNALLLLHSLYSQAGQFEQFLALSQPYLKYVRTSGNQEEEAGALYLIGLAAKIGKNYDRALEFYQQSLVIYQELGELKNQLDPLREIGETYVQLQDYDRALKFYRQFLTIGRNVYSVKFVADFLNGSLARTFFAAEQYEQIIGFRQEALAIYRELEDRQSEARVWQGLGNVYRQLDRTRKARNSYKQSLTIFQELGERKAEAGVLQALADLHLHLKQYSPALRFHKQVAIVYREIGDRQKELSSLKNIGDIYLTTSKYRNAVEFHQQYLTLIQASGDRLAEVATLHKLGATYQKHGQYNQSLTFYQKALNLSYTLQQQSDFTTFDLVGKSLGKVGSLLVTQEQRELGIIFYKAAINAYERIRSEYAGTDIVSESEFATLFLGKHEAEYRTLADLLLQQDRILEAQQVLDLLKVEELDNYLQNVRGNQTTAEGIDILQPERELLEKYNQLQGSAIQLGQELARLRQISQGDRTPEQQQRIVRLVELEIDLNRQFNQFIDSEEIQELVSQLSRTVQRQNINLEDLAALRDQLKARNAALLYPLILEDRLELILTTPNTPPLRRTVRVSRTELNQLIQEVRDSFAKPFGNPKISAGKLYELLIQPLETDLKQAGVQAIIYAPDGGLRYIPLAALYDGQQWLGERYKINYITARSLTDFEQSPVKISPVLAGAFATGSVDIVLGERNYGFSGLPFAGQEVETLVATLPNAVSFIDRDFNRENILPKLNEQSIVHFATHAIFVSGQPEESFIVFGNGDRASLAEIKDWPLHNVDLVVLSACQTGVGGLGNGEEVLGMGYQFQRAGATAVVASLWPVDDESTYRLMIAFYKALSSGATKAEALQKAQQTLLAGSFNHPFYWAPFILIGNGF